MANTPIEIAIPDLPAGAALTADLYLRGSDTKLETITLTRPTTRKLVAEGVIASATAGWAALELALDGQYFARAECPALIDTTDKQYFGTVTAIGDPDTAPGAVEKVVVVRDAYNTPIGGVRVWVSTDMAGSNVVAGYHTTDDLGRVSFWLTPNSYWLWRDHTEYDFAENPVAMDVSASG